MKKGSGTKYKSRAKSTIVHESINWKKNKNKK